MLEGAREERGIHAGVRETVSNVGWIAPQIVSHTETWTLA